MLVSAFMGCGGQALCNSLICRYRSFGGSVANFLSVCCPVDDPTTGSSGWMVDFLLTAKRDRKAALRFLRKAIGHHGVPEKITIDKSGANTAAIVSYNADMTQMPRSAMSSISTTS